MIGSMRRLSPHEFERLCRLAIDAGLAERGRRRLLLSQLPPTVGPRLRVLDRPADQLRSDIGALDRRLPDHTGDTLAQWLRAARSLAHDPAFVQLADALLARPLRPRTSAAHIILAPGRQAPLWSHGFAAEGADAVRALVEHLAPYDVVFLCGGRVNPLLEVAWSALESTRGPEAERRFLRYVPTKAEESAEAVGRPYGGPGAQIHVPAYAEQRRARMIADADGVVALGGQGGTYHLLSLAHEAGLPIVPIPRFGGASAQWYHRLWPEGALDERPPSAALIGRLDATRVSPAELGRSAAALIARWVGVPRNDRGHDQGGGQNVDRRDD